jgi:hypothetical protein
MDCGDKKADLAGGPGISAYEEVDRIVPTDYTVPKIASKVGAPSRAPG